MFFTGAGISAAAGIPTYREGGSSWKDKDLEAKSHASRYGNHLDELWEKHWGPVQNLMLSAQPTEAHKAIAAAQDKHEVTVITQNIDTLHEDAGSRNIYHLHGTVDSKCIRCDSRLIAPFTEGSGAPRCLGCGKNRTRIDAVLFGEMLSKKKVYRPAYEIATTADVLMVVGSGLQVHPAATMVMDRLSTGRTTFWVCKEPPAFAKFFTQGFEGEADEYVPRLIEELST